MKLKIKTFPLILLLFLFKAMALQAQATQEISVNFDKDCWLRNTATSEAFEIAFPSETQFTGLSAYILQAGVETQLWFRTGSGKGWQEWQSFAPNREGETPDRSAFVADPIQDPFTKIQFRSSDTLEQPVVFRLYFAGATEKKSPEQSPASLSSDSCQCPAPAYCGRSCWCPDNSCAKNYVPVPTVPTHIIVHHSAGFSSSTNFALVVAYYWDLHVNTNGWDDIGYNWLIDANGVVYEGRGAGVTGAHFSCLNSNTTGICLIGNFENTTPTVPAKNSLKNLAAWEACTWNIDVADSSVHLPSQLLLKNISGHRDANNATVGCPKGTLCPGVFLYAQFSTLRSDVASNPCLHLVGLDEKWISKVHIYPNPASEFVVVEGIKSGEIGIFDLQGREHLAMKVGEDTSIDLSGMAPGIYLLKVEDGQGHQHSLKLVRR